MTYALTSNYIGAQTIASTSTTQAHPIGTVVTAHSATYGTGEFVYLKGVASTVIGDLVIYDQKASTTTRAVAGSRGPVAVAMSANVADQYGWYQIRGSAAVKSAAAAAAGNVYLTATAGTVDDAVVVGDKVDGARYKTADGTPSAGFAVLEISRPSANANG